MKKRIPIFCIVFCLAGLYLASLACAAETGGEINWADGYVSAVGNGTAVKTANRSQAQLRPLAKRAAMLDAYRNLLETTKGVKLDSSTTVEDFTVTQDVIKTQVEGIVKGARIFKEGYEPQPDGSILATIEMHICISSCPGTASLVQALNLDQKKEPPYVPQQRLEDLPVVNPPPPPKEYKIIYDSSKPVTAVIFNLEGRSFEKVLLPVIVADGLGDGLVTVYSAKNVTPSVVRTHGVVRYANNLDQAKTNPRNGDNVMIIPVSEITKENMVVVKAEAARLIKETTSHGNDYLGEAKVIITIQ